MIAGTLLSRLGRDVGKLGGDERVAHHSAQIRQSRQDSDRGRTWPRLPGKNTQNLSSCSLFARNRWAGSVPLRAVNLSRHKWPGGEGPHLGRRARRLRGEERGAHEGPFRVFDRANVRYNLTSAVGNIVQ